MHKKIAYVNVTKNTAFYSTVEYSIHAFVIVTANSLTAKFVVSDWGDKVDSSIGCRTCPPGYIGWKAGTLTQFRSQLYPPFRVYKFGYRMISHIGRE